jgi:hypothetical protein
MAWENEELKLRISKKRKGKGNSNWRGGISFGDYGVEFSKELKTVVRKRDKFICKICCKNGFVVHHIDYNKKNNSLSNLITLCRPCHTMTNYNREYWENYFYEKYL